MKSLRNQLLKAGLTDKQSVKNVRKQKQKQIKKPKAQRGELSDSAKQVAQVRLEKENKDKELNRQRQLAVEKKAQAAQIKQLVQSSKIDRRDGELAYNFNVDGKIKKVYVTAEQQKQLMRNQIGIIMLTEDQFELVPSIVAEKIAQRDESYVVTENKTDESAHTLEPDDPYADYKIPDDLIW